MGLTAPAEPHLSKNAFTEMMENVPPFMRTAQQLAQMKDFTQRHNLLPTDLLNDASLEDLCQNMVLTRVDRNSILFLQGQAGTSYYVILKGAVEILKHTDSMSGDVIRQYGDRVMQPLEPNFSKSRLGEHLCTLTANRGFGEMSLIHETARATSALCSRATELIEIGADLYSRTLKHVHVNQATVGDAFALLGRVPPFQGAPTAALTRLAYRMSRATFLPHAKITSKGEKLGCIYIVESGEVKMLDFHDGDTIELARQSNGTMIGMYEALQRKQTHQFGYVAAGMTTLYKMELEDFNEIQKFCQGIDPYLSQERARRLLHQTRATRSQRRLQRTARGEGQQPLEEGGQPPASAATAATAAPSAGQREKWGGGGPSSCVDANYSSSSEGGVDIMLSTMGGTTQEMYTSGGAETCQLPLKAASTCKSMIRQRPPKPTLKLKFPPALKQQQEQSGGNSLLEGKSNFRGRNGYLLMMEQQQETSSSSVYMASAIPTERSSTNLVVQSGLERETRKRISTAPSTSIFFSTTTGVGGNKNKSLGAVLGFVGHPMKQNNQKTGQAVETAVISPRSFSRLSMVEEKPCGPNSSTSKMHTPSILSARRSLSPTAPWRRGSKEERSAAYLSASSGGSSAREKEAWAGNSSRSTSKKAYYQQHAKVEHLYENHPLKATKIKNRNTGNLSSMVGQLLPFNKQSGKVLAVSMDIPSAASPRVVQSCNDLKGLEEKARKSPEITVAANKRQEEGTTSFRSPRPLTIPKSSFSSDDVISLARKDRPPIGEVVVSVGASGSSFVFSQTATNRSSGKNITRQEEEMLAAAGARRKKTQRSHRPVTN